MDYQRVLFFKDIIPYSYLKNDCMNYGIAEINIFTINEGKTIELEIFPENDQLVSFLNTISETDDVSPIFNCPVPFENIEREIESLFVKVCTDKEHLLHLQFVNKSNLHLSIKRKNGSLVNIVFYVQMKLAPEERITNNAKKTIEALKVNVLKLQRDLSKTEDLLKESEDKRIFLQNQRDADIQQANHFSSLLNMRQENVEKAHLEKLKDCDLEWAKENQLLRIKHEEETDHLKLKFRRMMNENEELIKKYDSQYKSLATKFYEEEKKANDSAEDHAVAKRRIEKLQKEMAAKEETYLTALTKLQEEKDQLVYTLMNLGKVSTNLNVKQHKLLEIINQQKCCIEKLEETQRETKSSKKAIEILCRQKDQDIEDLRHAMKRMELLSQKQSSKDTDLINDLRKDITSKERQILVLKENFDQLEKDTKSVQQMVSKLIQQHDDALKDVSKEEKNCSIIEGTGNRDESYYLKFFTAEKMRGTEAMSANPTGLDEAAGSGKPMPNPAAVFGDARAPRPQHDQTQNTGSGSSNWPSTTTNKQSRAAQPTMKNKRNPGKGKNSSSNQPVYTILKNPDRAQRAPPTNVQIEKN